MISDSKSVLLKFAGLIDAENYILEVYLQQRNQNRAYFQLQYIKAINNEECLPYILNTFQRFRAATRKKKHKEKSLKSHDFK